MVIELYFALLIVFCTLYAVRCVYALSHAKYAIRYVCECVRVVDLGRTALGKWLRGIWSNPNILNIRNGFSDHTTHI